MTQETALAILKTGKNAFLTGEPGSGKTYTVNAYIAWLEAHGIVPAVTASTGIAATHIGGMTIHSWSGIGIRQSLNVMELKQLSEKETLKRRMLKTSVLIIDEISMLDGRTLAAVDAACRAVRTSNDPFGGLQVVFVGDFFQLPPVWRRDEASQQARIKSPEGPLFAFQSRAWEEANPTVCYLSEQHRQEDGAFHALLSDVRRGALSEDGFRLLQSRFVSAQEEVDHTRLFSHNVDVDRVNSAQLERLDGEARAFSMHHKGSERHVLQLKKSCLSPEELVLKVGARVMFTKNQPEQGFVNGTLGEVIGFDDEEHVPIVETYDGQRIFVDPTEWAMMDGTRTLAKIFQYPLRLAWAITVHKSQGMTLDAAVVDLSRAFEYGQGYVALSRVRSANGLRLLGWNERALQVHPNILASDDDFKRSSASARAEMESYTAEEREERANAFIVACGGSVATVERTIRQRKSREKGPSTYVQTLMLFQEGKSVEEIAEARGFTIGTIISHLEKLTMDDMISKEDVARVIPESLKEHAPKILEAFRTAGDNKLSPIFAKFNGRFSYDDLKFVRLLM